MLRRKQTWKERNHHPSLSSNIFLFLVMPLFERIKLWESKPKASFLLFSQTKKSSLHVLCVLCLYLHLCSFKLLAEGKTCWKICRMHFSNLHIQSIICKLLIDDQVFSNSFIVKFTSELIQSFYRSKFWKNRNVYRMIVHSIHFNWIIFVIKNHKKWRNNEGD